MHLSALFLKKRSRSDLHCSVAIGVVRDSGRWGQRTYLGRKSRISLSKISVLRLKPRPGSEEIKGGIWTFPKSQKPRSIIDWLFTKLCPPFTGWVCSLIEQDRCLCLLYYLQATLPAHSVVESQSHRLKATRVFFFPLSTSSWLCSWAPWCPVTECCPTLSQRKLWDLHFSCFWFLKILVESRLDSQIYK